MAMGKLWQMSGDAVQAITAGIAGYVMKTGHKPACVRVRDETLVAGGAAGVTSVFDVPVVVDKRIQPGCYLMCETVEP